MRTIATIVALAAATAATATTAVAQPNVRLSDVEYMQAARCAGIAASTAADTASINALLKAQGKGRANYISAKADELQSDAARAVRRANDYGKQSLIAERDGVCKRFLG
jgi:hypothetical protein